MIVEGQSRGRSWATVALSLKAATVNRGFRRKSPSRTKLCTGFVSRSLFMLSLKGRN